MAAEAEVRRSGSARTRYHGLDALRAWAMSMGLVLHAAWIMIPGEAGAPKTDASASNVTDYICLSIHTFRMQLFFVLAGLFACLLVHKRGTKRFASNRLLRVAVPLLLGWLVLCPIMIYQYNAAGLQSGAIRSSSSAWDLTVLYFTNISADSVLLLHLWFLYYLALVYAIVIALRTLICAVDHSGVMRRRLANWASVILVSRWNVFCLAAASATLLFPMKVSWGIEVDLASLIPRWPGLASYLVFFVVGWLIFCNMEKLPAMLCGWRWQLAAGIVLTVPYYFYNHYAAENGYVTYKYPFLVVEDVAYNMETQARDYPSLREHLLDAKNNTVAYELWQTLPAANQRFIREHATATENQLAGLLETINRSTVIDTDFPQRVDTASLGLPLPARKILQNTASSRTTDEVALLNRKILEAGFNGTICSEDVNRPYYYPMRAAYSYGYSLITWLLIFGCIGFTQQFFSSESRFCRYFSDASYWFYLAHLPVQFQILLWIGDEPWHWSLKFLTYILGTIAVLLPSYHYLVRPTWIGWLLNGKRIRLRGSGNVTAAPELTPSSVEAA